MIPTVDDVLYALPEYGPRSASNLIHGILRASPSGLARAVWISAAIGYSEVVGSMRCRNRTFDAVELAARAVARAQVDAADGYYSLAPVGPTLRVRATMLPEEP